MERGIVWQGSLQYGALFLLSRSPLSIHDAWGAGWCDHCEWPGARVRGWGLRVSFSLAHLMSLERRFDLAIAGDAHLGHRLWLEDDIQVFLWQDVLFADDLADVAARRGLL